jgi:hypothetical protein
MDQANPLDLPLNMANLHFMTTAKAPRHSGGCGETAQSWFTAAQREPRPILATLQNPENSAAGSAKLAAFTLLPERVPSSVPVPLQEQA